MKILAKSIMKHLFFIFTVIYCCYCVEEDLPDINTLLNDPEALFKLEKRLGSLLEELDQESKTPAPPPSPVACTALGGKLDKECEFIAKRSTIIKTQESLARNAKFLEDISNVSCARDCTELCCHDKDCDTSVYQDKAEQNCYLFQCGKPSMCVFADHGDYWMSSISKDVHRTHSLTPGGATTTHENELQNLGSDTPIQKPDPTEPATVRKTTMANAGQYCREDEFECLGRRECVNRRLMCDGKPDCADGSDEADCVDPDKPAYVDSDLVGNGYNNPLYNVPYGSQSDPQYPYGFPIPGMANQQQAGLFPGNQLYPGQPQSPVQPGGGYYVPAQGQAVPIPQTGNQLNGQWPFLDKSGNIGPKLYPNNLPYQPNQQTGYIPQQQQVQTGYIPAVQQPIQTVQQVNPNLRPVQQPASQTGVGNIQQNPAITGQVQVPAMPRVQSNVQHQEVNPQTNLKPQSNPRPVPQDQDSSVKHAQAQAVGQQKGRKPFLDTPRYPEDDFDNAYNEDDLVHAEKSDESHTNTNPQSGFVDLPNSNNNDRFDEDNEAYQQRHSSDIEDTFDIKPQPTEAVKPKVPEKLSDKKTKSNSEGYIDYSWIGYDSNSPQINGKKGIPRKNEIKEPQRTTKKPTPTISPKKVVNVKQEINKLASVDTDGSRTRIDDDRSGVQTPNRYPDRYRTRFDDFDRPAGGTGNRRPSYDRYPDQYGSNNRHRPSHGSRYPYYENNYPRGRGDRKPYPVWDSMKSEYYYPDDYEDKDFGSVPGVESMGTGQQGIDYPYVQTDDRVADTRQHNTKPEVAEDVDLVRPMATEAPRKPAPVTQAPAAPPKQIPQTTAKPLPVIPEQPKQPEPPVQAPQETDANRPESQPSDDKKEIDTDKTKSAEPQSTAVKDTKASNSTKPGTGAGGIGKFQFMNVESVEVDSYTDNSQGPIVALSLGLAITVILLIFVGCRLRTVKRRLRKGRALHSNEADYLINGMYL